MVVFSPRIDSYSTGGTFNPTHTSAPHLDRTATHAVPSQPNELPSANHVSPANIGQDASPGGGAIPVLSAAAPARGPRGLAGLGRGSSERLGGRDQDPTGLVWARSKVPRVSFAAPKPTRYLAISTYLCHAYDSRTYFWMVTVGSERTLLHCWCDLHHRRERIKAVMASTERYQRIKAYMLEAVGRSTGDRFARWKCFTSFSKKVRQRIKFGKLCSCPWTIL